MPHIFAVRDVAEHDNPASEGARRMTESRKEHTHMRLEGLDVARFFAFFGMVIVNFKIDLMQCMAFIYVMAARLESFRRSPISVG